MLKYTGRFLVLLIIVFSPHLWAPSAHAEGGLVFRPYWTFATETPVTHVQSGDIDGDGLPEVVVLTAGDVVYVLENDGELAWRYEADFNVVTLTVVDFEDDGGAEEIFLEGPLALALLRGSATPSCMLQQGAAGGTWGLILTGDHDISEHSYATTAVDLDGDGRLEMLLGTGSGIGTMDSGCRSIPESVFITRQAVTDIWTGDITGDGRPEIVPSLAGTSDVYVFNANHDLLWQQSFEQEVALVQGGDVDGDGQAEVVVLAATWELFVLEGDGSQIWHTQPLLSENASVNPVPGQLMVHDLDGDGRMEIVVMAPEPAVYVFDGEGHEIWRHPLGLDASSAPSRLAADDINGDGASEMLLNPVGQERVYLLDATGYRLAEYRTAKTTGALDYADLDGDGWGEGIVGTESGIHVFGTSNQVMWGELWQSPRLGRMPFLYFSDLNGDGQGELLAGSYAGQLYVLAEDGQILWKVDLEAPIQVLSTGDLDGDGVHEVVVGTWGGAETGARGQVQVLDSNGTIWAVPIRGFITSIAAHDLDGDNKVEVIVGSALGPRGIALLLSSDGSFVSEQKFDERVTAVGSDGGQILVGTEGGRAYRLTVDGSRIQQYDLGAKVIGLDAVLAATADGRVFQLDAGGPALVRELGAAPRKVQVSGESAVIVSQEQEVSFVAGDGSVLPVAVDGEAVSIAIGDLNGDGQSEMAAGTEKNHIHLFGFFLDQPPMLTKPGLAETRKGYSYSVYVNDPDGDAVSVTLEIWDPSDGVWLPQAAQLVQGQGRLNWEVTEPFDIWDSGQESRFRFSYGDAARRTTTQEIAGPFAIPTTPWYDYYGRRAGLGALVLAVPVLGLLLYRRQRAYHRSPVGRVEALLKELQANPYEALCVVHDLARDDPAQLELLPGLARRVGEDAIAELSEGFHLILTRPEVTPEGLRAISGAIESLDGSCGERTQAVTDLYDLCQQMLEANTVARIVTLRPELGEVTNTVTRPDTGLGEAAAEALADLGRVADALRNYQRVEMVEDKTAYLAQAIETLGRLDRQFQADLPQPERNILSRVALNWLAVSTNTLQDLQGRAQVAVSLKTHQLLTLDGATLSLMLSNTGRSPASNLTVTLLPGQGYTPGNGDTARLDILPAGRSEVVELPVSATPSADQFRAEFRITFDDRERSGKSLAFADMVRLLPPAAEFEPIPNPYVPGTPLSPGSPVFFGRDDLYTFVEENIAGQTRQNILVLIGQRRMGKTSFLKQLLARLGEYYLPVYIDGQSLGIDPGMANFFYDLALAIFDALAEGGLEAAEPKPEDFRERPSGTFEKSFLPAVIEVIGGRRLLLLFDEFEELEMRVASGKLEPTIFPFLRHLMQHIDSLGFIFVGTHRLESLSGDYWSIFFNIALYKHVAFLDESAARELIVKPVAEHGLLYDDLAVDKMLRVTAGHPYFLQLTCHALVNHANRERRGYLTIRDVNEVLGEMVELGEAHFAFLWEQSDSQGQLILTSLAWLQGQGPTVTATQIGEALRERGLTMDARDVTGTLERLVERGIVREVPGQPPRYEYKVELVRLWVERYKALGRVIEEVG